MAESKPFSSWTPPMSALPIGMTTTPPGSQFQPPSLSPLKLSSSLNSSTSAGSASTNNTNTNLNNTSSTNPRKNSRPPPKKTSANLFIPRKKPGARPSSQSTPAVTATTASGASTPLAKPSNLQPIAASRSSAAASPAAHPSPAPSSSSQPGTGPGPIIKGVSQAPQPIDAPFVEFDLLTGDFYGPPPYGNSSKVKTEGYGSGSERKPEIKTSQLDWNIFKFHRIPGGKSINNAFEFPIKLNRKQYKFLETGGDDEDDEMGELDLASLGINNPTGDATAGGSATGGTGDAGLLEGLNLQELKNVIVPSSAAAIGQGSKSAAKSQKLVPLKGPDNNVVIGPDGQPVMVPANMAQQMKGGRVPMPMLQGMLGGGDKGKGKAKDPADPNKPRRRNAKKTRQVFLIPEATRKLKKEERYPWVWEDATGKEVWEGRRVERSRVKMQLLQVCKDGTFRWYPAKKHYMFNKLPTWKVFNADEANERFEKDQKRKNPLYFAENMREHSGFSNAFRLHALQEARANRKPGDVVSAGSGGPGGRALKLVDRGALSALDREEADDIQDGAEEVKKEIQRERQQKEDELFGMEGDMDEMEYEEDIADDDERVHIDGMEEEEKEIEDRLKREWRQANKADAEITDETFIPPKPRLGKEGRRIKKMLRGQDKTGQLYESDSDEKDPYASEESSDSESDIEEKERVEKEKAEKEKAEKAKKEEEERLKQLLEEKEREREAEKDKKGKGAVSAKGDATSNKNVSGKNASGGKNSNNPSRAGSPKPRPSGKNSRAGSPAIRSTPAPSNPTVAPPPGVSRAVGAGNALTAMRATSPGSPKPRPPMGSTASGGTPRMTSPGVSGTSTPVGVGPGGAVKRKAEGQNEPPQKKVKTSTPGTPAASTPTASAQPPPPKKKKIEQFPGCLTQEMVVNYLKEREAMGLKTQTKDAIERFKPMWMGAGQGPPKEGVDIRNKDLLTHWIKRVANLGEGNWLTLR